MNTRPHNSLFEKVSGYLLYIYSKSPCGHGNCKFLYRCCLSFHNVNHLCTMRIPGHASKCFCHCALPIKFVRNFKLTSIHIPTFPRNLMSRAHRWLSNSHYKIIPTFNHALWHRSRLCQHMFLIFICCCINGRHHAEDIWWCILLNEKYYVLSPWKFVININNNLSTLNIRLTQLRVYIQHFGLVHEKWTNQDNDILMNQMCLRH